MLGRILLCLVAGAVVAHAHDPYEAWASANVHPDRLVLIVTMSSSTAVRLIDAEPKSEPITAENFPKVRPAFVRAATALFALTTAGKPIAAKNAEADFVEENDVVFTLIYPRPPAGPLQLRAAFLARLGPGYGSMLEVLEGGSRDLGWEKLSFEQPTFAVEIPAAKPTR